MAKSIAETVNNSKTGTPINKESRTRLALPLTLYLNLKKL
jgi:hypothetical protein